VVTKTIDLQKTPADLEDLLRLLESNTEILLTKGNTPLARLTPIESTVAKVSERIPGLHKGTTWVSDDFDAPLPDEFWLGES
jgi:antitoxin (DNA-binding transcriptional repressor) of toxin-antitoxin stability system